MRILDKDFDFKNNAYIMGILNVTPDSFSDGGDFLNPENALKRVEEMINEGASIIDVGGESTRPSYQEISVEEEIKRIRPVIKGIRDFSDITLSIDTFNYKTFEEAYKLGGNILNDITGLRDKNMALLVKDLNCPVILMHNEAYDSYNQYLDQIDRMINRALDYGIKKENIIIDPGIGFNKGYYKDLIVINRLEDLKRFNLPILFAASRKRFIGRILEEDNPKKRNIGTAATSLIAYTKGARIFRVHDVLESYQVLKMAINIMKEGKDV